MNTKNLLGLKWSAEVNRMLIVIMYRTLSSMSKRIKNKWGILQINFKLQKVFKEKPIIAFKRNKNIQEIIGGDDIVNGKVLKQQFNKEEGCYIPSNTQRTLTKLS